MSRTSRTWKARYDTIEQCLGVACPLLGALSLLDHLGLLGWAWLFFLWLSCGHWAVYLYDTYPALRHRPFVKGLFAFGVGVLWPVWLAAARDRSDYVR